MRAFLMVLVLLLSSPTDAEDIVNCFDQNFTKVVSQRATQKSPHLVLFTLKVKDPSLVVVYKPKRKKEGISVTLWGVYLTQGVESHPHALVKVFDLGGEIEVLGVGAKKVTVQRKGVEIVFSFTI